MFVYVCVCVCSHQAGSAAKKTYEQHLETYEESHRGGFRRIYPTETNKEQYTKFFDQNTSLCAETVASRTRAELSKQLREEVEAKQKELQHHKKKGGPRGNMSEVARPESPSQERKTVRVPRRMHGPIAPLKYLQPRNTGEKHENETLPQNIREEEEIERLAGLQLRESLVRGLGVTEQLQQLFESCAVQQTPQDMGFVSSSAYASCGTHPPPSQLGGPRLLSSATPLPLPFPLYHHHHHHLPPGQPLSLRRLSRASFLHLSSAGGGGGGGGEGGGGGGGGGRGVGRGGGGGGGGQSQGSIHRSVRIFFLK